MSTGNEVFHLQSSLADPLEREALLSGAALSKQGEAT